MPLSNESWYDILSRCSASTIDKLGRYSEQVHELCRCDDLWTRRIAKHRIDLHRKKPYETNESFYRRQRVQAERWSKPCSLDLTTSCLRLPVGLHILALGCVAGTMRLLCDDGGKLKRLSFADEHTSLANKEGILDHIHLVGNRWQYKFTEDVRYKCDFGNVSSKSLQLVDLCVDTPSNGRMFYQDEFCLEAMSPYTLRRWTCGTSWSAFAHVPIATGVDVLELRVSRNWIAVLGINPRGDLFVWLVRSSCNEEFSMFQVKDWHATRVTGFHLMDLDKGEVSATISFITDRPERDRIVVIRSEEGAITNTARNPGISLNFSRLRLLPKTVMNQGHVSYDTITGNIFFTTQDGCISRNIHYGMPSRNRKGINSNNQAVVSSVSAVLVPVEPSLYVLSQFF